MSEIIPSVVQIVNTKTGEVSEQTVALLEQSKKLQSKTGWTKMYRVAYDEVTRAMTSELEHDIFVEIRDSNESRTFILKFTQQKIAKKMKTSRNTVARVVSKLKKLNFLYKDGSVYKMNPCMYVPPLIRDEDIYKAQEEWKQYLKDKQ